jgi:WD40 repeat protein/subtilisin-like proprotein convertase family protein
MAKIIQAAEFFVVGGPVQPDRPCYVERAADRQLEEAIAAERCCCVLGPRAIGKSSLMGRVARSLRQRGELAAIVDLAQLGARGESADPDRWIYGIAHRIAHELRLKVSLEDWWREKTALVGEERLADFVWEIVLTNTTVPVTVFIDEIEQAAELPFARELFAAIRACYARRASERDYTRLNFVVLGVIPFRRIARPEDDAPFAAACAIELADFSSEEAYRLAIGFGGAPEQAQALMDRIYAWTRGHPYLTQKIARGVARKGGKLEDVERVVREQLLEPGAAQDEPLLNHMRVALTERSARARQGLRLLRRVAKGREVTAPADSPAVEALELAGVVAIDARGALAYRNRIFKEVFGRRWINAALPMGARLWAAAAVLVAAAALGVLWYMQQLPEPYIETLSSTVNPEEIDEAYQRLRRLPGFAEQADQLLAEALARRSGVATTLAEASAADTALRDLPGRAALADRLMAEFWSRQVALAMHAERRDEALLLALEGLPYQAEAPSGSLTATLAELVAGDYRGLVQTIDWPGAPAEWQVDWQAPALVGIDAERRVRRQPLDSPSSSALATEPLTALRHTPVVRELNVDTAGSAGVFTVMVSVEHPASAELLMTLAAPSGAQASVPLPPLGPAAARYELAATETSPLAALIDEERQGVWRLALVDQRAANTGTFRGWGLRFGEDGWLDDLETAMALPDPERTADVTLAVDARKQFAIARPAASSAVGSAALWSLADGRLRYDFVLPAGVEHVEINATGTRLLTADARLVTLWNAADGAAVARAATQTEFVLPPAFSADGGYVTIAERVEAGPPLYSLLRAEDGALLASVEGVDGVREWWVGPGARYVALLRSPRTVRVLNPRSGAVLAELPHVRDVARVAPLPDGVTLLTVDAAGDIRVWRLDGAGTASTRRPLDSAVDAASVDVAADGSRLAYVAADGWAIVRDVPTGSELFAARLEPLTDAASVRLSPDGARLVTRSGERFRLWSLRRVGEDTMVAPSSDLSGLASDSRGEAIALGFLSGELRVQAAAEVGPTAALDGGRLDYFGHAGAIGSVAINTARGVIATGGRDGTVRLWELADAAPLGPPLRHAAAPSMAPVEAVAISADGRWVASAADRSARVWRVADAAPVATIAAAGVASAVDLSADGRLAAIGDRDGNLVLVPLEDPTSPLATQSSAAIRSVALSPDAAMVATGDASGRVQLWRADSLAPVGRAATLMQPLRWVAFSPDGGMLLAATAHWLHGFTVAADGLAIRRSKLAPLRFAPGSPLAAIGGERVRIIGFDDRGALRSTSLDLAMPTPVPNGAPPPTAGWPQLLGAER